MRRRLGWSRRSRATAVTPSNERHVEVDHDGASSPSSSASSIAARPSSTISRPRSGAAGHRWAAESDRGTGSRRRRGARGRAPRSRGLAYSSPMSANDSRPVAVVHRRGARPGPGPPRRRHGALGDPLRGARYPSRRVGRPVIDWGNVESAVAEAAEEGEENARFLVPVLRSCEQIAALVRRAAESSATPIILGGDRSARSARSAGSLRSTAPTGCSGSTRMVI